MDNCILALNYSAHFVLRIESNLCNIHSVSPPSSFLHKKCVALVSLGHFLSKKKKKERRPIISIMLIRIVKHIHSTTILTFIYLESKHGVMQIEF